MGKDGIFTTCSFFGLRQVSAVLEATTLLIADPLNDGAEVLCQVRSCWNSSAIRNRRMGVLGDVAGRDSGLLSVGGEGSGRKTNPPVYSSAVQEDLNPNGMWDTDSPRQKVVT